MLHTILVVEDDDKLREYLRTLLTQERYSVLTASDAPDALDLVEKKNPDIVLLDLGLPTLSGETVCRTLKESFPHTQVIMLTGKSQLEEVVHGFSVGADDYIKKPFQPEELLARVHARVRGNIKNYPILKVADLELNQETIEVKRSQKKIDLTPQEFKLLQYLLSNQGRVLTREMILSRLWGESSDVETRVVDVYMGYLRKKIDADFPKKLIQSVRGFGYMIKK